MIAKKLFVVLAAVAMLSSRGAWAALYTGNELLSHCSDSDAVYNNGLCIGFIAGVSDLHSTFVNAEILSQPQVCVADQVTLGQLEEVVVKFLNDNRESLHESASGLVMVALRSAYPCE